MDDGVFTAREANQHFSRMLSQVADGGETVTITRHGEAVARLVPITEEERSAERARRREALERLLARIERRPGAGGAYAFRREDAYE